MFVVLPLCKRGKSWPRATKTMNNKKPTHLYRVVFVEQIHLRFREITKAQKYYVVYSLIHFKPC